MKYSIWIVNSWPNMRGHTRCFEEVALALQSAFAQLGHNAPIIHALDELPAKDRGRVIVLGAGVLDRHPDLQLPDDMIIYNFEQVHKDARFFLPGNPYVNYLRKYALWDYSRNNIAELAKLGITNVTMCGVGYMPELTHIRKIEHEDIDVLFIGSLHPRRQKIIDELKQRGLRVEVIQDMYGPPRDAMIARSKIILNLHLQPANVFEVVRVSYMLANRKCVVSEWGDDKELEGPYQDAVVFRPYEELVSACLEYISDGQKRREQEKAALRIFSAMSQVPMLEAALKASSSQVSAKPAPARAAGKPTASNPAFNTRRIFVNIASFRDPEIDATLRDMFANAAHPARVFAGVCLQIDEQKDALATINTDRPWQVRIHQVHPSESKGANWARAQAQKLWNEEEYVLQIDSHMRFAKGWDVTLIDMLEACPSEKPLLSTYVPAYTPPDKRFDPKDHLLRIRAQEFGQEGIPQLLHLSKVPVPLSDTQRSGLYPSPFYIANFMFCRSGLLKEIPFDPYITFWGDEITFSARLWTHGYDVFQPNQNVIWHYWRRDELLGIQPYRRADTKESKQSMARIKHLLGFTQSNDTMALAELEKYGLGSERNLSDLWAFAGLDWKKRTITRSANEGRWDMAARDNAGKGKAKSPKKTVEKADAKTSGASSKPAKKSLSSDQQPNTLASASTTAQQSVLDMSSDTLPLHKKPFKITRPGAIFINIASYRDPECQWTVKDLFEKANNPERIFVGICWQFDPKEDQHCFEVVTRPDQVRIMPVDWRDAEGVCWARYQTQQLWDGEEYNLMLDSHMRFMPGWDDLMINELAACPSPKPFLSCSPAPYTPPNNLGKSLNPTIRRARPFLPDGNLRCAGEALERRPEVPLPGAFMVANFAFSRSEVLHEVPYDPYLYFDQEEITYAARLFTHGWEIFSARDQFLFHYYNDMNVPGGSVRPLHWRDLRQKDETRIRYLRDRGLKRFNHMTGYQESGDEEVIQKLDEFGWGSKRSLADYEEFSGVDFKNKVATDKALRCLFINDLPKYRSRPITIPELEEQKRMAAQGGQGQGGGNMGYAGGPQGGRPQQQPYGERGFQQVGLQAPPSGHFMANSQQPGRRDGPHNQQRSGQPPVTLVSLQPQTPDQGRGQQQPVPPLNPQQGVAQPSASPYSAVEEVIKPAPVTLLERGDYMPLFEALDVNSKPITIERFAGKHTLLFFLPSNDLQMLDTFFRLLQQQITLQKMPEVWQLFVLDASALRLKEIKEKLRLPHLLLADPDRKIAASVGVCKKHEAHFMPVGFVLNQALKIISVYKNNDLAQITTAIVTETTALANARRELLAASPAIISEVGPALIVPDAFTPEMCDKCLHSFRTGHTFEGTVGADATKGYKPNAKIRQDHIPLPALAAEIDDKLSRSLFPEIKKVFGLDVTFRELYKIGLYSGEKKGFFVPHRDNFDYPLGYRRYAMTLQLTDDFEGGGLRFPEYDNKVYRPARGSAIVFSCGTMHEALPVTKGDRYIVVGFFHGKEEEMYRRYYHMSKGNATHVRDYTPTLRDYSEITKSRDFYEDWKAERFDYRSLSQTLAQQQKSQVQPYGAVDVKDNASANANYQKQQIAGSGTHTITKVLETRSALVLDNFLPEETYQSIYSYVQRQDLEHINTGKMTRARHMQDDLPLRSEKTVLYYADNEPRPKNNEKSLFYPTKTALDAFVTGILAIQPQVQHITGAMGSKWGHFSIASWFYPQGAGQAFRDDGSWLYSGAFVYYLNPVWKPQWGGNLIVASDETNERMRRYKAENDAMDMYSAKEPDTHKMDEILMEDGLSQCIFPKRNRIVFIASDAYHMVTRVNEQCGDNVRTSLAGFFINKNS